MKTETKQVFVRRVARENQSDPDGARIWWSRHAVTELVNEGWKRSWVEAALQDGIVIEDYPSSHRPLPDCLVLGWLHTGEPLHVVVAIDEIHDRLFIVTVYEPSLEHWEDDRRTRKQ